MREPEAEEAAIAAQIAQIRSLPSEALRRHWQAVFGRKPPAALSKDLLGRMIAHHLQERTFGGLDRDSLRFLNSLARQSGPPRPQLKPGTVLVREYQGRHHAVTVLREGFQWQGASYPSLSAVARLITGTAWSGPRFFALGHRVSCGVKPQRSAGIKRHQRRAAAGRTSRDGESFARTLEAT